MIVTFELGQMSPQYVQVYRNDDRASKEKVKPCKTLSKIVRSSKCNNDELNKHLSQIPA